MTNRIGPGPVFVYESLILARRWQVYAGRAFFVFAILAGLAIAWWVNLAIWSRTRPGVTRAAVTLRALADAGEVFFYAVAGIQITIVFLVAPAATSGAICQDRAQGILTQLAMTDLSSAEIVLGKLASRLAPVVGLLAGALPVMALATLLGGIDPRAVFGLFAASAAIAVLGCALALLISLWAVKAHEGVMAVLLIWMAWLMSLPIWEDIARAGYISPPPDWFRKTNPLLLVYSPYVRPNYVGVWDVILFVAGALLLSAGLAGMTIGLLRRSVRTAGDRSNRRNLLHEILDLRVLAWLERLPGPSLDGNPVLWREWHRNRPSRLARLIWGTYASAAIGLTAWGLYDTYHYGVDTTGGGSATLVGAIGLQFSFGLLLLCAQAPTSLAEERARDSLDVLMTTPLSTREIVWGKWFGTYRTVFLLTVLPALGAGVVACLAPAVSAYTTRAIGSRFAVPPLTMFDRLAAPLLVIGEMLAYGAAITSVGLALATWVRRLGRAVAINVMAFAFIAIGWPLFFQLAIWTWARNWLWEWGIRAYTVDWISNGMTLASPFAASQVTMNTLIYHYGSSRAPLWWFACAWIVLAGTLAGVMYWAVRETFDRNLGRISEAPE
jgi:ABC-type transport system involved in multi-copper enzyme maturation permease subunit